MSDIQICELWRIRADSTTSLATALSLVKMHAGQKVPGFCAAEDVFHITDAVESKDTELARKYV